MMIVMSSISNGEIMGFMDITTRSIQHKLYYIVNILQFRHWHDTMLLSTYIKETKGYDLHARRRILHCGGDFPNPSDSRGLSYAPLTAKQNARLQSGWLLEDQQSRVSRVHDQEKEYPSRRQTEINKATYQWWHRTIKNFTAVRLTSMRAANFQMTTHRITLPVYSIADCHRASQWLYKRRVHDRKVYS
jgi:hypothetical protein